MFGEGDCGQLGLGEDITEKYRPAPLDVDGKKVLQVRPGGMHTVAVTEDGSVYSWGVNDEGALGRETTGELWEKSPLATGKPTDSYVPGRVAFPAGAPPIVQLSAGDSHTCALGKDGSVWAWGTYRDGSGVLGFSPGVRFQLLPVCVHKPSSHAEQVVRISSGADHVAAVTAGGALLTWGNHHQGMLGRVGARLSDRVKMSTLLHPHPVPFKHKASAKATKIVDAVCGTYSTFAVAADGTIYAFGLNNYGQLALTGANPVWAPTQVTALKGLNVVAVSGGEHHSLARTSDGEACELHASIGCFGLMLCGRWCFAPSNWEDMLLETLFSTLIIVMPYFTINRSYIVSFSLLFSECCREIIFFWSPHIWSPRAQGRQRGAGRRPPRGEARGWLRRRDGGVSGGRAVCVGVHRCRGVAVCVGYGHYQSVG